MLHFTLIPFKGKDLLCVYFLNFFYDVYKNPWKFLVLASESESVEGVTRIYLLLYYYFILLMGEIFISCDSLCELSIIFILLELSIYFNENESFEENYYEYWLKCYKFSSVLLRSIYSILYMCLQYNFYWNWYGF